MRLRAASRGFTLLEVLLVMAILVILVSVSLPSLSAMYGESRVRSAADEVRGAWADARSRSIDNGTPYRFAVGVGGDMYRIAPDTNEYWDGSANNEESDDGKAKVGKLPNKILFVMDKGSTDDSGSWTPVAVFLPDGTCKNDAEIVVAQDGSYPHIISVRGLTGIVSVRTKKQIKEAP